MHPKSAPSYFCGENFPTRDYQWVLQVLLTFSKERMLELMKSLGYVRAYIDDLLCISKLSLEDHLGKLEEALRQLWDTGLKVNAAKLTFCALEIEYLGYVLTRDGIKPQSKKVQAILAIKLRTGVRQYRHFLGMV
jgi:hypothetical protein